MTGAPSQRVGALRISAWIWIFVATAVSTVGAVSIYRDPTQLRIEDFSALYESVGLSDRVMATVVLILPFYIAVLAAAFTIWRRPTDRAAVVTSMGITGLFFYISGLGHPVDPAWLRDGVVSTSAILIVVLLATVPTGTFVPRWILLAPVAALFLVTIRPALAVDVRWLLTNTPQSTPVEPGLVGIAWVGVLALTLVGQAVRYRQLSSDLERSQSRWLILGTLPLLLPPVVVLALTRTEDPAQGLVAGLLALSSLGSFTLPVAVLVAVFRYHLFEIDRIISRTATYGAVAAVVGLVYAIPVLTLPTIFGESNEIIVAGSTLAAAAVFNPVRRAAQRWADRRFNRSTYDAEQEVDALAARLRAEIELDAITETVDDAVARTVQPEQTTIWIRDEPT